ncbi:MAG TPA: protocatechuate 3,4-dioxygenase subunit alpha [Solirubrobacteraceae bacterium]|nr:protocatechuate 3,4-dioxygenase subunit alpha [Solirubrobacteraceae bacterium]
MIFPATPSQTVGPYFAIGLPWPQGPNAVDPADPRAIRISGSVLDGQGELVPDHMIEVWGASPDGRYPDVHAFGGAGPARGFRGFARCGHEGGDGTFEIVTLKPGPVPGPGGAAQAPHLAVSLFARGMLHRLVTRIYFADEPEANALDPILARIPPERRATLLAQPADAGYRFDIRLQGPDETVFLDI